jgi:ABC-2 type transport system ATP-binding protein
MAKPVAIIKDLTRRFEGMDKPALNAVSVHIAPRRITGLVGPDGAGKTTLIRHIVGLMHGDNGTITVDGHDYTTEAEVIHDITGYMPQKFGLYEDLSVIENLNLYADLRHITGRERIKKFERLLAFTDLQRFQSRLAGKLSGGMKQKLGLACALIGDPKLLLLDEPSAGVDPISRRELWRMVQQLLGEGMAVLWSTSYLDEAEKCDTVILLNEGEKLHDGPPDHLLQRVAGRTWQIRGIPEHERRGALMAMLKTEGVIDGVIQGEHIRIVIGENKKKPALLKGEWHAISPWFEDAFIDILGGGPGGHSPLAADMPEKPPNDQPVIDARGLTKRFGDFTAVYNNTFQIKRGEIFGLLGPNGAGKSTTFKMMCGLLQPTAGDAYIMGLNLKTATSEARSRIGYMAQKFSLYGHLTVVQNLNFFSGLYGLANREQKHRIDLMIEIFGFAPKLKMKTDALPLGFKQRLALCCAVMHRPDILFLDEPTSGVDPITRREFWTHINAMVEKGVSVMVSTHFMDEAEYCDRIGLIYRAENIATGTPDHLKAQAKGMTDLQAPTLEDAFIALIQNSDAVRATRQNMETGA